MISKSLYPKTKRYGSSESKIIITEKLDGSNLGIFKLNGEIYLAQRNNIFHVDEINKNYSYGGLVEWIKEHKDYLKENMYEKSCVFGEWISMGKIKYADTLDKSFYIFAKANVTDDFELKNLYYDRNLFVYPFINQTIPTFMGVVPKVAELSIYPGISELDQLYKEYSEKTQRLVEGFIINNANTITKYVRCKNGVLTDTHDPNPSKKDD